MVATKYTWYYNLSKLCDRLGIDLELDDTHRIKAVEQGDRPLVAVASERGHRGIILKIINVVCRHLKLIHLPDLVLCDGVTLCQETL